MATIQKLQIKNFRNITEAALLIHPKLNAFIGENGAGKSSLLEAMSLLAHGKSFRTNRYSSLINSEADNFVLFTELSHISGDSQYVPIGMQRFRNGTLNIKVNEDRVASASQLATLMPLIVINSNSFQLIEGSPKDRRKFFDWLVFHVKHSFASNWSDYRRCLKQRNTLVRGKMPYESVVPWDLKIATLGQLITEQRLACCEMLTCRFTDLCEKYGISLGLNAEPITLEYQTGWPNEDFTYSELLERSYVRDLKLGYTSIGAHKGDLKISIGKRPASEVLSRGQTKLMISLLYIATAQVYANINGSKPIFCIDDLPSELDKRHQALIVRLVEEIDCQFFVSGIDESFVSEIWPEIQKNNDIAMFHVKHGEVSQMNMSS